MRVITLRGAPGSGKSTTVRQFIYVLAELQGFEHEFEYLDHTRYPIVSTFQLDRPLSILGTYQYVQGGCDKVGGLDQIFELVSELIDRGHDVLFEGGGASRESRRTLELHNRLERNGSSLIIIDLKTPPKECLEGVYSRRAELRDFYLLPPKKVVRDGRKTFIDSDFKACIRSRKKFEDSNVEFYRVGRKKALILLLEQFGLISKRNFAVLDLDMVALMTFMREHECQGALI